MYKAEVYFNKYNGQQATKAYTFEARNLNHAIRRVVKTGIHSLPTMHFRVNIWGDDGSVHVYVNQVAGQHAGVTVGEVFYPSANFAEAFPG